MHAMIFIPGALFCAVAVTCWTVCAIIDRREARAVRQRPVRTAAPRRFSPIVIEGGLKTAPGSAPGYFRPWQRPLPSLRVAAFDFGARTYGG